MKWLVLLYVNIAIVTFGHCWATFPDEYASGTAIKASFAGAAWPLYWSVRAWEATR
jgi:hypothetical protein